MSPSPSKMPRSTVRCNSRWTSTSGSRNSARTSWNRSTWEFSPPIWKTGWRVGTRRSSSSPESRASRRWAAGHPGHAAGRADGGGGEGAGEAGAATGEAVDVGSEDAARAIRAGGPGAVIVGHEEDHVGTRGGALAGLHEGRSHPGQKERAAVDWHRDPWERHWGERSRGDAAWAGVSKQERPMSGDAAGRSACATLYHKTLGGGRHPRVADCRRLPPQGTRPRRSGSCGLFL